ncbi:MAG: alpha/beta hydrolase [Elusimicrobia bacterium]|nr:alpha/beta hydrolase [Elusimicrobiota bacterium]
MTQAAETAAVQKEFIQVGNIKTWSLSAGSGEPVLLLHGMAASSYSWRHLLPALAGRFRVYAPDFPGFGRSGKPANFDYSVFGYQKFLLAYMDEMGLDKAHLIGNSMGGMVSLLTAIEQPERIKKLVLIAAPAYPDSMPVSIKAMCFNPLASFLRKNLGRWSVELITRRLFVDHRLITKELVDEYAAPLETPEGRRAIIKLARNMAKVTAHAKKYQPLFKKTPHETLIICGDKDALVSLASARRLSREMPNAKFLPIASCGHGPQEEKPDVVNKAVLEFLNQP